MTQGLILLGFLAVLTAWIIVRVRRRLGLPVTSKTVTTVALGFVLIVLVLYALAASGH